MGKSWEDIVINWDGDEIPLLRLVALWLEEDTDVTYRNLKGIEAHLITHDFDIPEAIAERLENSAHKKRHKGEKKNTSDLVMRDASLYFSKRRSSLKHGESEAFTAKKADGLGLQDEKHLAERIRKVGKFFEQGLEPHYINVEYKYFLEEANNLKLSGQKAERYALRIMAKRLHTTQSKIKIILK